MKTPKQLERIFKGVANHRRVEILTLINKEPGISLFMIARELDCNLKTIAEHTRRLVIAGLVDKKHLGNYVSHKLSPYGEKVFVILKSF